MTDVSISRSIWERAECEEREKDEKTGVWTDLLIIAVLLKFSLQHVQSTLFGPLVIFVFIVFLSLRSHIVHSAIRSGLSLAALDVFSIDVRYSLKSGALTIFMAGLASLFLFIMRRFLGFFFR